MAIRERDVRTYAAKEEPPLPDLIRQLGQDAATLVRQEIALAKVELTETAASYARDAGKVSAAAALGWMGALALLAAIIIGLGTLLDNFWLSALIVAVVLLATAAVLGRSGVADMKRTSPKPEQTMETLQEDKRWARNEIGDFKRDLKR